MPNAALFITTHTGAIPISTAVATTLGLEPNAPSPTRAIAGRPVPAARPRRAPPPARSPSSRSRRACGTSPGVSTGYCWADPVLVPADVGDEDRVRDGAPEVGEDPLRAAAGTRPTWRWRGSARGTPRAPGPERVPVVASIRRRRRRRRPAIASQRERRIRGRGDRRRVVAPGLVRVDVHVDEPGRRDPEGHARLPAAAVRLREPGADGEQDVGLGRQPIRGRRAPEADHARAAAGGRAAGRRCPSGVWTTGSPAQLGEPSRPRARRAACRRRPGGPGAWPDAARRAIAVGGRAAERRPLDRATRARPSASRGSAEDVHRHRHQDRTRAARRAPVSHARARIARDLVRATDAPRALHERLVDRHLVGVAAQVELLVRAASLVVRRHVAGDDQQRARSRTPPSRRPSSRSSCPARRGGAATPGRPLARA